MSGYTLFILEHERIYTVNHRPLQDIQCVSWDMSTCALHGRKRDRRCAHILKLSGLSSGNVSLLDKVIQEPDRDHASQTVKSTVSDRHLEELANYKLSLTGTNCDMQQTRQATYKLIQIMHNPCPHASSEQCTARRKSVPAGSLSIRKLQQSNVYLIASIHMSLRLIFESSVITSCTYIISKD
jgi:hypothetical protein